MDFLKKAWEWLMSLFWKKEMSITIIGLSNAGKSTLVHALMGDKPKDTVPTIGCDTQTFKKGNVQIKAHEIGGHSQFQFLWNTYCQNSSAILFILDASDENAVEESAIKIKELTDDEAIEKTPILICGNKIDLKEALNEDQLISRLRLSEIEKRDIALFTISAKENIKLDSVINWLINHA